MEKKYGASSFIMDSGERYCHVVDRNSGLPEYYPNLFMTTQVRNSNNAFSTVGSAASLLVLHMTLFSASMNMMRCWLSLYIPVLSIVALQLPPNILAGCRGISCVMQIKEMSIKLMS